MREYANLELLYCLGCNLDQVRAVWASSWAVLGTCGHDNVLTLTCMDVCVYREVSST